VREGFVIRKTVGLNPFAVSNRRITDDPLGGNSQGGQNGKNNTLCDSAGGCPDFFRPTGGSTELQGNT
jgi:hypothetical protein